MLRPTALVLLATAALAGCGGDDGASEEETAVRQTVERFYASAAEGDGREACRLTDSDFRETVGAGCPEGLTDIYRGQAPEVRSVTIDGDRATARVSDPPPDDVVTLLKEDDGWRILLSGE